ncbi:MAG: hypothetical protein CRN43_21705 [Candidatus Nephrothrix sp. EaCA]|nr:MAG: hypothetical protein CRN43_21705 [Candidatus Nephrothrix sp. EaCA]
MRRLFDITPCRGIASWRLVWFWRRAIVVNRFRRFADSLLNSQGLDFAFLHGIGQPYRLIAFRVLSKTEWQGNKEQEKKCQ